MFPLDRLDWTAMPPRNVYIIIVAAVLALFCHRKAEKYRDSAAIGEAMALIDYFYVDRVDKQKLLNSAMTGLTAGLDPYTQYIPPGALESFEDSIQQEFAGIGILIEQPGENQGVRVITPLVGSPALEAGFQPGDWIIEVAGKETEKAKMDQVSQLLRGPIGSEVQVTVRRKQDPSDPTDQTDQTDPTDPSDFIELTLTVKRANIQLDSVAGDYRTADDSWVYRLADAPDIAYVRLTGFGERTTVELRKVLKDLDNNYDGLILDLRGNAGGLLTSAVEVCDMFLNEGMIVSTRGRGILDDGADASTVAEESAWRATPGTLVAKDKPVTVLVDRDSASAAEIVAACLKDHGRATVVGERSFGKGSVQNVFPLENGRSALKLTTARYYRPNGHNIHRKEGDGEDAEWGVKPTEGFEVKVEDAARRRLYRRLEMATYPSYAGSLPEEEQVSGEIAEVDPQLFKAIESIRDADGASSKTSGSESPAKSEMAEPAAA